MEGHPIPRQITTFEFKLIGFLTLKQFIYLIIFIPLAFIVFKLFPIPILNLLLAIVVVLLGIALAFVPVNSRPIDVWIRNLIKRLTSPTQFVFRKKNNPLYFLQDIYFVDDPHIISSHIKTQEKLNQYFRKKDEEKKLKQPKKNLNKILLKSSKDLKGQKKTGQPLKKNIPSKELRQVSKTPFFTGIVINNKNLPLPGILIYIKDEKNNKLRLLKTNPHGIFATFRPLPQGEYTFEIVDPSGKHFFDTIKTKIEKTNPKPFNFISKKVL